MVLGLNLTPARQAGSRFRGLIHVSQGRRGAARLLAMRSLPPWPAAGLCRRAGLQVFPALAAALLLSAGFARAQTPPAAVTSVCASCHGQDGNSTDPKVPRLAGQAAGYVVSQLKAFASGTRRSDIMQPVASALDEAAWGPVAAWFSRQRPGAPAAGNAALAEPGRTIWDDGNTDTGAPSCAGCHGADGAGNARFPRLAGQHAAYTRQQMLEFRSGRRAAYRLMVTVAQRLSDKDIEAVSDLISTLPSRETK